MTPLTTWHPRSSVGAFLWICTGSVVAQATWQPFAAPFLTGQVAAGPSQVLWHVGIDASGTFATSQWNGQSWVAAPLAGPPARVGHTLAFDPVRSRLMLFGGRTLGTNPTLLGDLWEFDGSAWSQANAGVGPTPRYLHSMAWDASRNRIVVGYGSTSLGTWTPANDLWEWDGTTWSLRPVWFECVGGAIGFDPVGNELVLVGGQARQLWGFADLNTTYGLGPTAAGWASRATSPAVFAPALAFHAGRNRLVLTGAASPSPDPYGGQAISTRWVYEWTGAGWAQSPSLPVEQGPASAAFDAPHNQFVVVGGRHGLTLEDATTTSSTPQGAPLAWTAAGPGVPRSLAAISYDPRRARLVGVDAAHMLSMTWEWNGSRWLAAAQPFTTPWSTNASLVWDPVLQQTLLVGVTTSGYSDQFFTWNGAVWTELLPAHRPSPRYGAALTADRHRNRVVLYGGSVPGVGGASTSVSDVWEWDGVDWTQVAATAPPGALSEAVMAFDRHRRTAVLFGGFDGSAWTNQTWEYNGTLWTARPAGPVPAAFRPVLFWDEARARVVLLGPSSTHEYDGVTWTNRPTISPPIHLSFPTCGAAYDEGAERALAYTDHTTWVYETPFRATATTYGSGCAGSAGPLRLEASSRPWLGSTVDGELAPVAPAALAAFVAGFSNQQWGSLPLPLPLASLGAPGCDLLAEPILTGALSGATTARPWALALPNLAACAGLDVFAQGCVFDALANPLGVATSNGVALRLGIR